MNNVCCIARMRKCGADSKRSNGIKKTTRFTGSTNVDGVSVYTDTYICLK